MSSSKVRPLLRFVIPAYNEEENLPHLLTSIRKFLAFFAEQGEVWVVDDGSSDRTAEMVQRLAREVHTPCPVAGATGCTIKVPVHLLRHEQNHGPGRAFLTGLLAALHHAGDHDYIVTIEADNTSDLSILNRMLEQARRGNDVVLASVYGEGRVVGAPLSRRVLSWGANTLVKTVFRFHGLHTFSSFFRLHRAAVLRRAFAHYGDRFVTESGFVCMIEMLVKLQRLGGVRIAEVPMLLDANIRIGDSKMKIMRTTSSYLRLFYWLGVRRGWKQIGSPFPVATGIRPVTESPGRQREVAGAALSVDAPVREPPETK
ncbi:MAG: glycosyltransferase family 2 protein [Deltaproteobacteria bacterium]|nr:glycosyltransferase family 2 protein [Deltaproteobacteria bacterium]